MQIEKNSTSTIRNMHSLRYTFSSIFFLAFCISLHLPSPIVVFPIKRFLIVSYSSHSWRDAFHNIFSLFFLSIVRLSLFVFSFPHTRLGIFIMFFFPFFCGLQMHTRTLPIALYNVTISIEANEPLKLSIKMEFYLQFHFVCNYYVSVFSVQCFVILISIINLSFVLLLKHELHFAFL